MGGFGIDICCIRKLLTGVVGLCGYVKGWALHGNNRVFEVKLIHKSLWGTWLIIATD